MFMNFMTHFGRSVKPLNEILLVAIIYNIYSEVKLFVIEYFTVFVT